MSEEIVLRISKHRGSDRWSLTATVSNPHRGARGLKMVPVKTITRSLHNRYASALTPKLLAALVQAVELVAAGYYEDVELPFD